MTISEEEQRRFEIETWRKSIDVQMHFNDVCLKVRNFYISVVSALLALAAVFAPSDENTPVRGGIIEVDSIVLLLLAIMLATVLFYFIDRYWYHQLLLGAVSNAADIERRLGAQVQGLQLTSAIGKKSPIDVSEKSIRNFFLYYCGRILGGDQRIRKEKKIHSDAKIAIFYKSVFCAALIALFIALFAGAVKVVSDVHPGQEDAPSDNTEAPSAPEVSAE